MKAKIYPHDRLLAATILKIFPHSVRPNQITVVRFLLTPFVILLLAFGRYAVGVPFFLFVAFTDLIDGSLARTRGQITAWGTIWDPVADKLLIGSVVVLMLFRAFSIGIALTLLALELAFVLGGWLRKRRGVIRGSNWWGKWKMVCQVVAVTCFLIFLESGFPGARDASYVLFGIAAFLALCSLLAHGL